MISGICQEFIEALEQASTVDEIHKICSHFCTSFGIGYPTKMSISLCDENPPARHFPGASLEVGLQGANGMPMLVEFVEAAVLKFPSKGNRKGDQGRNRATLSIVYLLSAYLHQAIRRVRASEQVDLSKAGLTEREKECLLWAAEGKTSWETAQILKITERTVIFHLQNATRKLNAANRQNAIARAVGRGLITPQLD